MEGHVVVVHYVRHPRARRYRLAWLRDGTARCTLPMRGSLTEARRFVERSRPWLAGRIAAHRDMPSRVAPWTPGTRVWFRGELTELRSSGPDGRLQLLDWEIPAPPAGTADLRGHVERAMFALAARELPDRTLELAEPHGLPVRRIAVRNQRSRWGSCSRRGTVSLNWRLVQVPLFVRDYILFHELAHLRHMNHSARFWAEVSALCPAWEEAERWLRKHGKHII